MRRRLHVLTGPTAVGKTALALAWAEQTGAEIVSCDSLLFYRGLDLGTAKPTAAERIRVPHHLIDVMGLDQRMDVVRYVEQARTVIEVIAARGRPILVTGGSGFYLKAFFHPVADEVAVPAELRAELNARLETEGLDSLLAELRTLNPGGLGSLDLANPRRVVRALERCRASGRTLADLAAEFARQPAPFSDWEVVCTRLDRPRADLDARIAMRVALMLRDGLVAEVEQLLGQGLRSHPSAAAAIGYRETIAMLDGQLPREALADEIVKNTRALVKKQLTWFRTQLPAHRVIAASAATVDDLFGD